MLDQRGRILCPILRNDRWDPMRRVIAPIGCDYPKTRAYFMPKHNQCGIGAELVSPGGQILLKFRAPAEVKLCVRGIKGGGELSPPPRFGLSRSCRDSGPRALLLFQDRSRGLAGVNNVVVNLKPFCVGRRIRACAE